jgi:hypothetical protein
MMMRAPSMSSPWSSLSPPPASAAARAKGSKILVRVFALSFCFFLVLGHCRSRFFLLFFECLCVRVSPPPHRGVACVHTVPAHAAQLLLYHPIVAR